MCVRERYQISTVSIWAWENKTAWLSVLSSFAFGRPWSPRTTTLGVFSCGFTCAYVYCTHSRNVIVDRREGVDSVGAWYPVRKRKFCTVVYGVIFGKLVFATDFTAPVTGHP